MVLAIFLCASLVVSIIGLVMVVGPFGYPERAHVTCTIVAILERGPHNISCEVLLTGCTSTTYEFKIPKHDMLMVGKLNRLMTTNARVVITASGRKCQYIEKINPELS